MIVVTLCSIPRASAACAAAVVCLALAGCSKSPTSPSAVTTLSMTDLVIGTGAVAASGDTVTVDYTGWLYDPTKPEDKGLQFQTSIGQTPLSFTLGAGQVVQGFDSGVTGMLVGGERRLIVPASEGYGNVRNNSIPPNSALVFEVTLDSVTPPSGS